MRLLTLGRLGAAYDRLANHIKSGQHVLDIGCGTGALTLRIAQRGAIVQGIDCNAQMLEIAGEQVREAGLTETVDLQESGVAELDKEEAESYDAATAGLCFSELSEDELDYTLKQVVRVLLPGGLLLIADEVKPRSLLKRFVQLLVRIPLAALTYALTQQTSHPLSNLEKSVTDAGLSTVSIRLSPLGSFIELVARKPGGISP
jgi:demethylmenaquinone methyltransferase/2-methoxy-6-polyprenyl-1,4-benzoquinol methylase